MAEEFHLTGKHVLAALVSFFLVILAANVIMINFALKSFPGEKEKKSYLQGLNYNDRLAERAEQTTLGWTATIEKAALAGGRVDVIVRIVSDDGKPVSGLEVTGVLSRPASHALDASIVLREAVAGNYMGSAPAATGIWVLEARAVNQLSDELDFTSRLILQ